MSRARSSNMFTRLRMLSVKADATIVANIIAASRLLLSISHRNAPQQTVVGGKQSHIAQLAQQLDDEGLTSRLLPVYLRPFILPHCRPLFNRSMLSLKRSSCIRRTLHC
ncbi:MAG: hypothetical protein R3C56_02825 [Pirellulaceae bacterium]